MQNSLNDGIELSKGDAVYRVFVNGEASTALEDGVTVCLDLTDKTGKTVVLPAAEGSSAVIGIVKHPKGRGYSFAAGEDCIVCVDGITMGKVDGTDDIAAGSRLKVFDTNGIAYEAVAGTDHLSCIFGMAMDAYTDNDSDGYIPVWVGKK